MRFERVKYNLIIFLLFIFCFRFDAYSSSVIISSASQVIIDSNNAVFEQNTQDKKELDLVSNPFLMLINHSHPIALDYVPPLEKITGGQKMHKAVAPVVENLLRDAARDKINLYVVSGYRSSDRQGYLFNKKFNTHKEKGKDDLKSYLEAIKVNPLPGTSEHQSGLCMDIVDMSYKNLDEKQEETAGYKWMIAHCTDYGFILRYPKNKTNITGIIYEPWHFRFVGIEAAKEITAKDLTLEEYVLGAKIE